jgi:hypothetical protein
MLLQPLLRAIWETSSVFLPPSFPYPSSVSGLFGKQVVCSTYLPSCLCLSVCLSVCLWSACLSIYLSIYLWSAYLSVCLPISGLTIQARLNQNVSSQPQPPQFWDYKPVYFHARLYLLLDLRISLQYFLLSGHYPTNCKSAQVHSLQDVHCSMTDGSKLETQVLASNTGAAS